MKWANVSEKDQFLIAGGDEGAVIVYEISTLKDIYSNNPEADVDYNNSIELIWEHAHSITSIELQPE